MPDHYKEPKNFDELRDAIAKREKEIAREREMQMFGRGSRVVTDPKTGELSVLDVNTGEFHNLQDAANRVNQEVQSKNKIDTHCPEGHEDECALEMMTPEDRAKTEKATAEVDRFLKRKKAQ